MSYDIDIHYDKNHSKGFPRDEIKNFLRSRFQPMSEDATGLLYWPEPDQQTQFYQRYFTIIIEGIYFKRGSLYMTKRDFSIYLDDILKNMQIAEEFLSNTTFKKFAKDTKTSYAVIRCLEIIGEAVKHIPTGVRNKYPEVPWKAMGGISWRIII